MFVRLEDQLSRQIWNTGKAQHCFHYAMYRSAVVSMSRFGCQLQR